MTTQTLQRNDYWLRFWEETGRAAQPAIATGRASAKAQEFLYTAADICAKLELNGGDRLLDIGCGSGHLMQALAFWVGEAVAVDYAESQVLAARENLKSFPNARVQQASALELPFADGAFTKVLCWSVLQYLEAETQLRAAFAEIARVLAPGGKALIAGNPDCRCKTEYLAGVDRLERAEEQKALIRERQNRLLWTTPGELAEFAREAGLRAEIVPMDPHIWQSWYMYDVLATR